MVGFTKGQRWDHMDATVREIGKFKKSLGWISTASRFLSDWMAKVNFSWILDLIINLKKNSIALEWNVQNAELI